MIDSYQTRHLDGDGNEEEYAKQIENMVCGGAQRLLECVKEMEGCSDDG